MTYIRSTIFTVGLIIFTIPHTTLATLFWLTPFSIRRKYIGLWSYTVMWWLKVSCNLTYQVVGKENIPNDGKAKIILAKHQSAWETIAMQQIFPTQTWVLKRELLWLPFFGWGLLMTRPIAINRSSAKQALKQVIEQGKQRLQSGLWVVIFPEGTRTSYGSTEVRYAAGGALLATKSGYDVIPVAHNAGKYWPKDSFLIKSGVITLSIGKPIDSKQLTTSELLTQVQDWIEQECKRIG